MAQIKTPRPRFIGDSSDSDLLRKTIGRLRPLAKIPEVLHELFFQSWGIINLAFGIFLVV